jgi:hypothetical protein
MAAKLNISVEALAKRILSPSSTPEERFTAMKKFYTTTYPKSVEFYEKFSNQKRKLATIQSKLSFNNHKSSIVAPKKIEPVQEPFNLDYYENLSTFENVLELIEDNNYNNDDKSVEASQKKAKNTSSKEEKLVKNTEDDVDSIFEQFMNNPDKGKSSLEVEDFKNLKEVLCSSRQTTKESRPFLSSSKEFYSFDASQDSYKSGGRDSYGMRKMSIESQLPVKDKYDSIFDELEKDD